MISEDEKSLSVIGTEKINGGFIPKDIKISGMAKILSNFECLGLNVIGKCKCRGELTTRSDTNIDGLLKVMGNLQCFENLNSSGELKAWGSAKIGKSVKISGKAVFSGNVDIKDQANLDGRSLFRGNLTVDNSIKVNGKIKVYGSLSGDLIEIRSPVLLDNVTLPMKAVRSKIHGSIFSSNTVILSQAAVLGNVVAPNVILEGASKVVGKIYYSNSLKLGDFVKTTQRPEQIPVEKLEKKIKRNVTIPLALPNTPKEVDSVTFRYCPVCGNEYVPPRKFCAGCGANLS